MRGPLQRCIIRHASIAEVIPTSDHPTNVRRLGEIGQVMVMYMEVIGEDGIIHDVEAYYAVREEETLEEYNMPLPPRLITPTDHDQLYLEVD